jgi:thiopurine S-methyltransferase
MEEGFWHQRWREGAIGFHLGEPNPLLVAHFDKLQLPSGSRIFLPLCGKTTDFSWLLAAGYRVAGAELSRIAIDALFDELGVTPTIEQAGALLRYRAPAIDIFVGNIFDVSASLLEPVDAIYDRAALVALPETMRTRYAAHLQAISGGAPQLLVSFEYDQRAIDGPPFSIDGDEVARLYAGAYRLENVDTVEVAGGLKGQVPAVERVWLLQKHG